MENYAQIKVLGKGAFGSAWLVQRRSDRAKFVAKEVRLAGMKPAERESAKHEISMLRKLDHPNITRYVDHFESRGSLFIVMEYADGGDLYSKIKGRRGVRFTEKEILHYFSQICLALLHLHDKRILHRDLKSQNVFLTSDGIVKLGDFGISTVLRNTYELKRTVCGTPYYFSPELCMNRPYNNKSDVWALGCILYELTTLNHAFDGNSMKALVQKILKGVYPPIHNSYSPDLAKLVAATLKLDPAQRPNVHQILGLPFIREHLAALSVDVAQANKDKRSCVAPAEQLRERQEAQDRVERAEAARKAREAEAKAAHEQREKARHERMEELRRQMEQRQREHEEQLRHIREREAARQAELDERRRQLEARAKEQRKAIQERAAQQAKLQRQREEEWEKNMAEMRLRAQQAAANNAGNNNYQNYGVQGGAAAPARAHGGYDPQDAARAYREMRREAEANKLRAMQDQEPQRYAPPQPQPVQNRSPPNRRDPPPPPVRKPMTEAEMEEARRQAFWQMRREAEENKRRLLGLDPLPPPQAAPAPAQAQSPNERNTPPPVRPKPSPTSPGPALKSPAAACPMAEAEEMSTEDDEEEGYRKFLNNEAIAQGRPEEAARREVEYNAVQKAISDALNGNAQHEDFEDADDNDPTKFVLDGQTLHLPNCNAGHPLMSRIESLRLFLEHSLGEDMFLRIYRAMDNIGGDDDEDALRKVESMLPQQKHKFIPVIAQLLVCEEYFNDKGNAA